MRASRFGSGNRVLYPREQGGNGPQLRHRRRASRRGVGRRRRWHLRLRHGQRSDPAGRAAPGAAGRWHRRLPSGGWPPRPGSGSLRVKNTAGAPGCARRRRVPARGLLQAGRARAAPATAPRGTRRRLSALGRRLTGAGPRPGRGRRAGQRRRRPAAAEGVPRRGWAAGGRPAPPSSSSRRGAGPSPPRRAPPLAAAGVARPSGGRRGRLPSAIILCSRRGGGGDGAGLGSIFKAGAPPAGGARPGPRVPPPAGCPGPRRAPFPSLPPAPVRWAPSSSYRLRAAPSLLSFAPGISPQFYSLPHVTHRVKLHLRRVTHTHTGAPSPATGRQRPTEERQPGSKRRARRGPHGNRRALTETAERAAGGGNGRARRRPPRKEPSGRGNERSAPEGWRKEPSGRGKARTALPPEAARGAGGGLARKPPGAHGNGRAAPSGRGPAGGRRPAERARGAGTPGSPSAAPSARRPPPRGGCAPQGSPLAAPPIAGPGSLVGPRGPPRPTSPQAQRGGAEPRPSPRHRSAREAPRCRPPLGRGGRQEQTPGRDGGNRGARSASAVLRHPRTGSSGHRTDKPLSGEALRGAGAASARGALPERASSAVCSGLRGAPRPAARRANFTNSYRPIKARRSLA